MAECIRARFRDASGIHWRQLSVLAELCILLAVAFLPQSLNMAANVSVSFVCAVQVESFRKVHGNAFATTMCTGNLRSGTERLYQFLRSGDPEQRWQAGQIYRHHPMLYPGGGPGGVGEFAAGGAGGADCLHAAAGGLSDDVLGYGGSRPGEADGPREKTR